VSCDPDAPSMVVFEPTRISPLQERFPCTRTTFAVSFDTALVSADAEVTVTADALPPPVTPPFCDAQPTTPRSQRGTQLTSSHCWLYWLPSVSWVTVAPSAVERSVTVTALLLCRLRSRTRPPSASTSRSCAPPTTNGATFRTEGDPVLRNDQPGGRVSACASPARAR
jgi:hypothetical protein